MHRDEVSLATLLDPHLTVPRDLTEPAAARVPDMGAQTAAQRRREQTRDGTGQYSEMRRDEPQIDWMTPSMPRMRAGSPRVFLWGHRDTPW